MKIKNGFTIKEVAGVCVVVSTSSDINLNGMISLNSTGQTIWKCLENDCDVETIIRAVLEEYDTDYDTAKKGVEKFIGKLQEHGFIED